MPNYGFIGLGDMGSAMCEHLLSTGAEVTVFDLDSDAVATVVRQGAAAATSTADVAQQASIVSICVPAAAHVEAVMTGEQGIEGGAHQGLTVLVHSTVHPDTVTGVSSVAAAWGVDVFDVCVAGGSENARVGELAMLVGGWDEMPSASRALVEIYGSKVINGGPVGGGAALKIGTNVMTYMQQAAARIAFALMEPSGADPSGLVEAWRHTNQLGELTERYLALLRLPGGAIAGDLRTYLETVAGITEKDLRLACSLGSVGGELDAVLAAMASAALSISRVG